MTTATRTKGYKVTQRELDLVHKLKAAKFKVADISSIVGVGTGTVHYLGKAETIEEYRGLVGKVRNKKEAPETAKQEEVAITSATPIIDEPVREYNTAVFPKPVDYTAQLNRLADAVERMALATESLVEAWEKPNRKRFL